MDGFPILGTPDTGDTAWMLVSSALVLLMTPGLAFFYGGMVRRKGVLNMIMMSISAMGVVTVLWVLYGYSMAFGNDKWSFVGDPTQYWGLKGLIGGNSLVAHLPAGTTAAVQIPLAGTIPQLVFVAFQLMFAIITVALISGAVADRLKFGGWLLFAGLWATFVYFPVAHWVFAFDGITATVAGSPTSSRQSTSPVVPRCTSTPVPRAWCWPSSWASARAGPPLRCGRTTCRSSCWAPVCCGSVGTASTPARH